VGDGSPGSREAEGEGGEGFYVAQSGRCPDLLVIGRARQAGRAKSSSMCVKRTDMDGGVAMASPPVA